MAIVENQEAENPPDEYYRRSDVPTTGEYYLGGEDVANGEISSWPGSGNRMIGFIFQQYNLLPKLNLLENVELLSLCGNRSRGTKKTGHGFP